MVQVFLVCSLVLNYYIYITTCKYVSRLLFPTEIDCNLYVHDNTKESTRRNKKKYDLAVAVKISAFKPVIDALFSFLKICQL